MKINKNPGIRARKRFGRKRPKVDFSIDTASKERKVTWNENTTRNEDEYQQHLTTAIRLSIQQKKLEDEMR